MSILRIQFTLFTNFTFVFIGGGKVSRFSFVFIEDVFFLLGLTFVSRRNLWSTGAQRIIVCSFGFTDIC